MNPDAAHETATVRGSRLALLAIVLLGAALRLYHLGTYSIWYDEGATLYAAQLVDHPLRLLDADWCTDPPLLPLLTRAWWDACTAIANLDVLTEKADFFLRLLPCLFSIAAIPLTFFLARDITGAKAPPLFAAFLVAVSPFQIYYAQELKPYSSLTLLGLGALYCMLRALERDKAIDWTGMTLLMILSMYNHFYSVWTILACNVAFVMAAQLRFRVYVKWFVSQCAVIALSWPAIRQGLLINRITTESHVSWYPPLTSSVGLLTFKDFFAGYSPSVSAYATLGVAAALLSLLGAYALRRRYRPLVVVCVVAVLPVVGNLVLWQTREFSYYQHRLFILSAILCTILVAQGIAALGDRRRQGLALAVLLVPTAFCLRDVYAQRLHPSEQHRLGVRYKVDNRAVANLIHDQWNEGDAVVHFSHFTLLPLRYRYLPDVPQCTIGFTEQDVRDMVQSFPLRTLWEHVGALPKRLDRVASGAKRIWLVESWWEPDNLFPTARLYRTWLDLHAVRAARYALDGVTLYLYDRKPFIAQSPRVASVADAGDSSIPYYVRVLPAPEALPGNRWKENFEQSLDEFEESEPTSSQVIADGPGLLHVESDTPQVQYTLRSTKPGGMHMAVMESADTILPLQFDRDDPEADDWRPLVHGNPDFKGDIDEVAYAATMNREKPRVTGLSAIGQLAPGDYTVYARIWREVGPVNTSRAAVSIDLETGSPSDDTVNTLLSWHATPLAPEGKSAWHWFPLGTVHLSTASQVRVRVNAQNNAGLVEAHVDLGRVCFLPETALPPDAYGYGETVWHPLSPGENGAVPLTAPKIVGPCARLDVVIYDADQSLYRSIALYLDRK